MKYNTVRETALQWSISERTVRNLCSQGKIDGAFREGKRWNIPATAERPRKEKQKSLLELLKEEKKLGIKGGIYHRVQVDLTYNSNHMEGSRLTHDQTRFIYETNTVGGENVNVDDVVETANHFRCIDLILENVNYPLSERLIKQLHLTLKNGTRDSQKEWFRVGEYKKLPNEVGGLPTTLPENVGREIRNLLTDYSNRSEVGLEDILEFHYRFEKIHPFQNGNGRVGRLILFKECLRHNIVPFIIDDSLKLYYYRGLAQWEQERDYLTDTCLTAQDRFKKVLDYFRIPY